MKRVSPSWTHARTVVYQKMYIIFSVASEMWRMMLDNSYAIMYRPPLKNWISKELLSAAEIRAILTTPHFAWELGLRKIIIETESSLAFHQISGPLGKENPYKGALKDCK
ncbi:hypothetical protein Nepgr_023373 [Nepenthes gracilis]|uniref:RNase H type-1 domain-containing protein n=1 Tax=Nepenthes gracilis TaxID=150966 RepID=A0AAD3T465_NEPGR|nr:hypothetical protein Nepgr_023373 [Nepenthes gracilis]